MASSSELIKTVSESLGVGQSRVSNIFKQLQRGKWTSSHGRGRNAAAMTGDDAANLIIAVCATDRHQDACLAVEVFHHGMNRDGRSFPVVLSEMIENPPKGHITVSLTVPYANARINDDLYLTCQTLFGEENAEFRDGRRLQQAADMKLTRSFSEITIQAVSDIL